MDYVSPPDVMDVPTDVAVTRVYMAMVSRAAEATGGEWQKWRNALDALTEVFPEPIAEWHRKMGFPK